MKMTILMLFVISAIPSWGTQSVGHRGAPYFAPENTIVAFRKAIDLKADFLEIDIQRTQDGHLVVMHDSKVNRTTNAKGRVEEFNLGQIRNLDAGSWFSDEFKGEKVPTLDEVFDLAKLNSNIGFIVELKKGDEEFPGIEMKVVNSIKMHNLEKRVILKSFSYPVLQRLRRILPETKQIYVFVTAAPTLNIMIDSFLKFQDPLNFDVEYLQPHGSFIHHSFIEKAHYANKKVIVWGVENREQMKYWIFNKADAIETDRLDIFSSL